MSDFEDILVVRHSKRDLYLALLSKGIKNLTETEVQLLSYLSVDKDIMLLLSNGYVFNLDRKEI